TMCAKFLRPPKKDERHNVFYRISEWMFDRVLATYTRMLKAVLVHQLPVLVLTLVIIGLSAYLYVVVPKGFFPQQDTGRIGGSVQAAQDISFEAMSGKMKQFVDIVMKDPAVNTIVGFAGGNTNYNTGRMFVTLKPLSERKVSAD